MTFSRQGRVEARFTLLFWLIEKVQCLDVKMLFQRSERVFFAVVKQQVLADSGEHLRRDVEERGYGVEREMPPSDFLNFCSIVCYYRLE